MPDLRYDWRRIEELTAALGEDFDSKISQAVVRNDLDTVAVAIAIGRGNGATAESVKDESPPIYPAVGEIMTALNLAFHGKREAPPADGASNPPRSISWIRRVAQRFGLA